MKARQFLIVATARSGSNQLVDYFNQVPKTKCFGEVFKPDFPGEWGWQFIAPFFANDDDARDYHKHRLSEYWDRIVERSSSGNDWVGAKLFYEHRGRDPLWSRLHDDDLTVVHLYRPRVMDLFLSLLRAEATGVWIARDEASLPPDPEIDFPEERYLKYRAYQRSRFAEIRNALSSKPNYWELNYDDISNPTIMSQRLNSILGRQAALKETLIKQSRSGDLGKIRNHEVAAQYADDLVA